VISSGKYKILFGTFSGIPYWIENRESSLSRIKAESAEPPAISGFCFHNCSSSLAISYPELFVIVPSNAAVNLEIDSPLICIRANVKLHASERTGYLNSVESV